MNAPNPPVLIPLSRYGRMSLSLESAKRVIEDGDKNPFISEARKVLRDGAAHWIAS